MPQNLLMNILVWSTAVSDMKLLLHVCCGPCMTSFDKYFKDKDIEYSALFYNPNIHPYKEYLRRYKTLKEYAAKINIELIHKNSFMQSKWEYDYNGMPAAKRCAKCYMQRLRTTASIAAEKGFTHFTSTLLISPYQNHELMIEIGNEAAIKYGVDLFYDDFREYFREGQSIARDEGLYRQKYCGCIYSYRESKFIDKINWD